MIFQKELIKRFKKSNQKIAIEYGDKKISYLELLASSNAIMAFLLEQNLRVEGQIGILLGDRSDLISAIIGISNARGVFVPLDINLPEERLAAMQDDLGLQGVIGSKRLPIPKSLSAVPHYFIEDILERKKDHVSISYPKYDKNDSLYIYFTSGSTGKPKGIIGRNCSLLQFINWEIETFNITSQSRVSQFISPYFDAFLRDVFVPLMAGGTVCIPLEEEDFFTSEKLLSWIDYSRVSLIHCVPSLFYVINCKMLRLGHFKRLKYILMSGERINPSSLNNWYDIFGKRIQLVNLYGTTETTMIRTYYIINPADVTLSRIPIGSPISETEILISNKNFIPCKKLVPGDLYIISDYMTKGYLNRPQLMKKSFLKINKGPYLNKISFNTGDKARILADGRIEVIGRSDRQIKLRGIRIELDEIEIAIGQSEIVKNVAVTLSKPENGQEHLLAFVIKDSAKFTGPDLEIVIKGHLQRILPESMSPAKIICVDEFPLLNNGKIDYKSLIAMDTSGNIVLPSNQIESKLLTIWQEILGDKVISIEDSFQRMGGNSLGMMRLIGRIYKEYNVRISLKELFENLTIKEQSVLIQNSNKDMDYIIRKSPSKSLYRASSAQERMYYSQESKKESTSYNLPMAWEINGAVDKVKIEQVFKALIERHEVLRTEFKLQDNELFQLLKEEDDFSISELEGDGEVSELIQKFVKPFDLNCSPLIRAGIIRLLEGVTILVVDLHHIICDGISQMILFSDFALLYTGNHLAPLDITYKDYSEWEYNFKSTNEYISHREFWLRNFDGELPRLELPIVRSDEYNSADTGSHIAFAIEHDIMQPLIAHSKKEGMTVFSVLFSIYYIFLTQLTGQEDITIGVATSGRLQDELEKLVGMFVKTLPVRFRMDPFKSYAELLSDIDRLLIDSNSNQIYDLSNIVKEINFNREEPISSLFSTTFVYHNFERTREALQGQKFVIYNVEQTTAKYPISLVVSENKDSFRFEFEYLSAFFSKEDMELLISEFRLLTEQIANDLNRKVLEIIGASEQEADIIEDDIAFNF